MVFKKYRVLSLLLALLLLVQLAPAASATNEIMPEKLEELEVTLGESSIENPDEYFQELYKDYVYEDVQLRPTPFAVGTDTKARDIVLVIDESGSMAGQAMTETKKAALNFCQSTINKAPNTRISIVSFSSSASVDTDFTNDLVELQAAVNGLSAWGGTNTNSALLKADAQLKSSSSRDEATKIIFLLSDGQPETGLIYSKDDARYSRNDYGVNARYASAVYNTAKAFPATYDIYTLGFFHNATGTNLKLGQALLRDIQTKGYFDVDKAEDLEIVFGDIEGEIFGDTFTYSSGDSNYQAEFFYKDEYFNKIADEYQHDLATMSLCLAMSAFSKAGVEGVNQSDNVRALFNDMGFEDFAESDNFKIKPTSDSIAVAAANKSITQADGSTSTVIAIAVRGGGYGSEWSSNFKIGTGVEHQGFSEASDQVLTFIKEYTATLDPIKLYGGNIKIWITGYSRGAATANLTAAALNEKSGVYIGRIVPRENIYAYCFETPAGTTKEFVPSDQKYKNIKNIINRHDPVPKVAPAVWGFRQYGETLYLPTNATSNNYKKEFDGMRDYYGNFTHIDPENYAIDDFVMTKVILDSWGFRIMVDTKNHKTQDIYLDETVKILMNETIGGRENYVANYQYEISKLMETLNWYKDTVAFDTALLLLAADIPLILFEIRWNPFGTDNILYRHVSNALQIAGIDYSKKEVKQLTEALSSIVFDFVFSHPNYAVTGIMQYEGFGEAHYPELCLAWMQSMDTSKGYGLTNGKYRIIYINCPVDVEVLNDSGELVAKITDNTPEDVGSSIISALDEHGQKILYLPMDTDYTVNLVATDDGVMNYSISEFSTDIGTIERKINYYGVPLTKGNSLTGIIANNYDLLDSNNKPITPSEEFTDAESIPFYNIDVTAVGNGAVTGSTYSAKGEFVMLIAQPFEGEEFLGWFENNVKLDIITTEYRFMITADRTIEARFTENNTTTPTYTFRPSSGSDIIGSSKVDTNPNLALLKGEKPFTLSVAKKMFAQALANREGTATTLTIRPINYTKVDLSVLQELAKLARESKVELKINFDSVVGKAVVGRISVNPQKATQSLNLTLLDNSPAATSVATAARSTFQNALHAFSFNHKGSFGSEIDVAVKVPSNIPSNALVLYSYDSSTQKYNKILDTDSRLDANGYICFKTTVGHSIILSNGELKQK